MTVRPKALRIAARAELGTLLLLLGNLVTVHHPAVSSVMGPAHGCAYLFVIGAVWRSRQADGAARTYALIPGIGGLLAERRLAATAPAATG
ncbi:DUF3817 domain-containing protein [Streptomyces sp. NPDC046939]|uniref:DUF3817 domain-containing protein n=1 Tax=Streptomyces sp. NPDC046939 TaxID=3155376 RepID=UPI00340E3E8A